MPPVYQIPAEAHTDRHIVGITCKALKLHTPSYMLLLLLLSVNQLTAEAHYLEKKSRFFSR